MKRLLLVLMTVAACAQTPPVVKRAGADPLFSQAESLWKRGDFDGAEAAFEVLIKANPKNVEYRVRNGDLFAERFNPDDAFNLYTEALAIDPANARANLGIARLLADRYEGKATVNLQKALETDPKMYEAYELLAWIALEDNNDAKALAAADSALEINPTAQQAIATHAAIDLLGDVKDSPWLLKLSGEGKAFETIAHFFVINRRYEEGILYYRKAIAAAPSLWTAHSQLGVNLMRLGREEEARKELELAYENHHRDKPTVNSLRLLDTYDRFITYKTPGTILKLDKKEAEALKPYFEGEMLRAIATYEKKYKFKLGRPIQVEVYPNHDDFAVRTMGMPGLGILGVTFNDVVAMDSPSGRKPGEFHWAATLWHELSHVYTLAMTNYRVPRWFTEGVAVHEESAASPDWGDRLTPDVILAIRDKKLLPIADIDRGFVHPTYPAQVVVSYYQGGKICDYISERWGETKILDMLREFGKNRPTVDVVKEQLGIEPAEFDKDFLAYIDKETAVTVKNFESWTKQIKETNELVSKNKSDEVPAGLIDKTKALEALYPDYVESGNAYELTARLCLKKKDKACALEQYGIYAKKGGREPEVVKDYAALLEEAGNKAEATRQLERLNYVTPLDQDLHVKLGMLYMAGKSTKNAIREYQVILGMKPLDVAGSHYNLAMAYKADGRNTAAQDEAFAALEAAPGFKPAQKLLLELSRPGTPE